MNRSMIPTRKGYRAVSIRWYPNGKATVLQWEKITRERPPVESTPTRSPDEPPSRRRRTVDKQGNLFG